MACLAATLDLKAEKGDADPYGVNSVQFTPDGSKIVSGGASGTIKVWGANPVPFDPSEWDKAEPDEDGDILWTNARTAEERWQYAGEAEPSYGELCADSNLT